jgi:hypothetical protein
MEAGSGIGFQYSLHTENVARQEKPHERISAGAASSSAGMSENALITMASAFGACVMRLEQFPAMPALATEP